MAQSQKIVIKGLRSSYPHLFSKDNMSGKYTCDFIMSKDHPQLEELKKVIREVYADAKEANKGKSIECKILCDGDAKKPNEEAFAGSYFFKTKTSVDSIKNNVFNKDELGVLSRITDESEFYAGCNCEASIVVRWYEFQGKVGVHVLLNGVCRTPGGEAFGKSSDTSSDFGGEVDEDGVM